MATVVNLPWNWVVESLANCNQVDPSVLTDLVKRTPGISDDLGKNAREMVSLRILESLFPRRNGITAYAGSALDTKIGFDPSESCEDVLQHILHEETLRSNGTLENSKWDVRPFIIHKRSSLPKCALQQLKEAILKGSHPLLASLKERSGLIVADNSEIRDSVVDVPEKEVFLNPGIRDDKVQGDFLHRNLLHAANRVWNESATEIPGEPCDGNHITVVNQSNELNPVKNLKLESATESIEESSGGFVQHTRREECNFSKEPWVEGLQESRSPDGGDDDHVSSKKIRRHSNESNPAKKLKVDSVCMQPTVNLNSVPSQVAAQRVEPSGGLVQHVVQTEVCDLSKEPWVGLEESRLSCGVHDEHVASKMLRKSCDNLNEADHAKKLKQDSIYTKQTLNWNSASSQATELIEDPSGGFVQHIQREECNFSKECVEDLEESRFPDGVHDEHVASKMLRKSCDNLNEADHAKKLKQDSIYTKQTLNWNSASSQATELIEDPSGGFVQHIQREECNFSKECVEDLEESRFPDGDHGEHVASKKLGQCCNVDDAVLHGQQQIPRSKDNVPQEMSGDGQSQVASVFKDGSDEVRELSSSDQSKHKIEDKLQANTLDGAAADRAKDSLDHNHEPLTKKHAFLSSQYTYIEDSMQTIDLSEVSLCVKCNEDGQVLVCSSEACPVAVHESCLGSATSFDGTGNFYCPFCTYSRAISVYREAKRKVSLARKDLEAFVGFGSNCRQKKSSKRLSGYVQNQPTKEHLFEETEANYDENNMNTVNNTRCRSYEKDKVLAEPSVPYVNDDLPSVRKETAVTNKENCDLIGDELEGQTLLQEGQPPRKLEERQIASPVFHGCEPNTSSSIVMETGLVANETNCGLTRDELEGQTLLQECQPRGELEEQQIAGPVFHGCEPNTSSTKGKEIAHVANETNCSVLQDKLEGLKVGQECQSPSEQEEQQIVGANVNDWEPNTSSFRGKEIHRGSNIHSQNTVLKQLVTDIPHETSTSILGSSEEDHKPAAYRYSIRSHKQKPLYTYPASPSLRRKVIPWTNLEEKTLKDGVQRFSNVNDKVVPWNKILDFGGTVFQGRTAVDLKDKWRNICKGSRKQK